MQLQRRLHRVHEYRFLSVVMLFGQVKLPAEHAAHQFEKKRFFAGEDMEKGALPDARRSSDFGGRGFGVAFFQKERHCRAQHFLLGQKATGLFPPRHVITSLS